MMTMTVGATRTDVPASEWMIDDAVTRLREWGTDTVCVLPELPEPGQARDSGGGGEGGEGGEGTEAAPGSEGSEATAASGGREATAGSEGGEATADTEATETTAGTDATVDIEATAGGEAGDGAEVTDGTAAADGAEATDGGKPSRITIGAGESCTLRLDDPDGHISRVHAALVRSEERWLLRDLGSKNGLRIDGARKYECLLQPGAEIGIGPRTLIAESSRSVALRGFLARLLGWRSERIELVDHALRSIRMAAARRCALVMCGDGDLVPMAHSLHRHSLGPERPFIVCDPRRRRGKATVRAAENFESGMDAFAAATGGSLCVRGYRLPKDFTRVVAELRSPESRVQLIVCSPGPEDYSQFFSVPISVPPLASRLDEIDRIIREYADDAIRELRAPRGVFTDADREWVRMYSAKSLPDIEKGTMRLVAINLSRNISNAAERLGMAPVSLSRWIGRRTLPIQLAR